MQIMVRDGSGSLREFEDFLVVIEISLELKNGNHLIVDVIEVKLQIFDLLVNLLGIISWMFSEDV